MSVSLKEKARARRKAALNSVRYARVKSPKIEILRREFPVERVCEPIFASSRHSVASNLFAAA